MEEVIMAIPHVSTSMESEEESSSHRLLKVKKEIHLSKESKIIFQKDIR
jgi:hypothetical protein